MIKNYYLNGIKAFAVLSCALLSIQFSQAQTCGSIDLGSDVTVCKGNSVTLTPTENLNLEGYLSGVLAYAGQVSNPSKAVGSPDGNGAYFCRGNSGQYTGIVWQLPCTVPSGTKLYIRVKVPSGSAYYKIYGAKNNYSYSSNYTCIATKYNSGSWYQDICVTTNGEYNIIKIVDLGCAPFKVDAIKYEKTCSATYSWSSGESTKTVTVTPTVDTDYIATATVCGNEVKDTIHVTVTDCGATPICEKRVGNTRGCSNKPYVIWLKDKNGSAHHLSGDSTQYEWLEYTNGDARLTASGLSASGLNGTFDVDILFEGKTSVPPTNSPKYSSCFTVSSASDWEYFATTTGTITSTSYGNMTLTRMGPAAQIGDGANITQDGYGASGWFTISGGTGYFPNGDFNVMLDETCLDEPSCTRVVSNTVGCANQPYVIYLTDANGSAHHLQGDTNDYQWLTYPSGDVRFVANAISASGLSGTFDVDLTFSGRTSTPPTNSPKTSTCFTTGSTTDWEYFTTTSGTIISTHYGNMSISRMGEAFQLGDGANITQDGFGASGWLTVTGGNGHITGGDINVMLSEECEEPNPPGCDESHVYNPCIVTYGKGSYNNSTTTISINENVSEIDEIVVEGIYKGGQPTSGSFTNGTSTVNWSSGDANSLNNVSGTTDKGYYQATLGAASSVSMHVSNNQSKMHGFVAYVKLKSEFCESNYTSLSNERNYVYHTTKTTTFTLPTTVSDKTITAVLPIAEMNNDTRIATFTLTAGGVSQSVTINTYDLDRSMTIQTLTINDVPGGLTQATLEIKSPSSNGDSYIAGNVMFNWYNPCETSTGGKNRIEGTVFFDADRDTTLDILEIGQEGVTVYLYSDDNDNGILDNGETTPIDSTTTDVDGEYEFEVDYACTNGYINSVTYQSSIDNPNNMLGAPNGDFSGFDNNADNLIVELDGTVAEGSEYSIFLGTIQSGAYAIISESTDGINFYHNTDIAILTPVSGEYVIVADRDVNYIKFDKNTINSIPGYNTNGSTSTNSADYNIYGIQFCKGLNSYIINTNLTSYPNESDLTTDNIEVAQFNGPNQEDVDNDFGFNGDVLIDGYVFLDENSNGTFDSNEGGTENITVKLFVDLNCNGEVDGLETAVVLTDETDQDGYYSFVRPYVANLLNLPDGINNCYIMMTETNDYPVGHTQTTDNSETAAFDGYNAEDNDNNFGHNASVPENYCGQLEITIDKNKVEGDEHEDFPVYLDLTHNAFVYQQDWTNSYNQGMFSPNGYDIQVSDEEGNILPIEIVGYDSAAGNIKLWVKVLKLSGSSDTKLYMKHGVEGVAVPNPSSPNVWNSDYKAVYHFEDLSDATSNQNDPTNYGVSIVTGKVGNSAYFDGNDYLRAPYSSSLDISGKKLTMSAWVRVNSNPSSDAPFAVKGPDMNQEAYMFGVDGGTDIKINSRVTTNTGHYRHDDGDINGNQWAYVQFVYDGDLSSGQKKVYVNGDLEYTKSATGDILTGNHDLFIGKRVYSDNRYLTGRIDELRISCASNSASWIGTEYNNQVNPNTFATITDSSGCGAIPVTWLDFTAKKVSSNDVKLEWSTATEVNNSHFEVERSFDGETFEMIGAPIVGAGNTTQIMSYESMDYNLPEGVTFYRVKQIDFDGKYDYTPVRMVQMINENGMVVYPNPAKNEVNVSFEGASLHTVTVMTLAGQVIDNGTLSSEGFVTLNTAQYPHGVYFIKVEGDLYSETQKLVIRK